MYLSTLVLKYLGTLTNTLFGIPLGPNRTRIKYSVQPYLYHISYYIIPYAVLYHDAVLCYHVTLGYAAIFRCFWRSK